jgi:glycosyltransferase involved in cell wall biosynthesis
MLAADHVVTLSEGMRDEVAGRGVAAERITVVPNAVGSEWLSGVSEHDGARERLRLDDALLVGTVSSINGYEGLDLIGEVVAGLRARGVNARGVVVGDGPALDELRASPHAEHVTFTGRVSREQAMTWHRAIDVFLVPRLDTTVTRVVTPIKPLEAMATGSLVVAADLPALRETVPQESGGIVLPRDARAWVDAIAQVAAAGEIAERGESGRRWVEENRTWDALVATYDQVYAVAGRRLN